MRVELTRPIGHYPLKVARLPIPPPGQKESERRDSDPRPRPWQGRALPTELLSHSILRPRMGAFVNCGAKIQRLFELAKFFAKKIELFFHTEKGEELVLTVNVLKLTTILECDGG